MRMKCRYISRLIQILLPSGTMVTWDAGYEGPRIWRSSLNFGLQRILYCPYSIFHIGVSSYCDIYKYCNNNCDNDGLIIILEYAYINWYIFSCSFSFWIFFQQFIEYSNKLILNKDRYISLLYELNVHFWIIQKKE